MEQEQSRYLLLSLLSKGALSESGRGCKLGGASRGAGGLSSRGTSRVGGVKIALGIDGGTRGAGGTIWIIKSGILRPVNSLQMR